MEYPKAPTLNYEGPDSMVSKKVSKALDPDTEAF